MEKELLKKTKRKKRRITGMILIIVLLAGLGLLGMTLEKGKSSNKAETGEAGAYTGKATIEITCSELSENMDRLTDDAVADYIPEDGVILKETDIAFADGETVYDCLYRICRQKDIHLETSNDPVYKSRYVEGIGHLYEKDGGRQSGWVYEVDGEQPDYGCSNYELEGGEKILWKYVTDRSDTGEPADVSGE